MAGRMCREMSGCGDEERLASERGGRVIIFSQEFPHLKSSLGSPLLYVCSPLLHYIAAASGPWLHGAIPSASVCVCVCALLIILSLLITTLSHPSSFYLSPHRTCIPHSCHHFFFYLCSILGSAHLPRLNRTKKPNKTPPKNSPPFKAVTPE